MTDIIYTNLFNIDISNIRYNGANIKLIKFGGNIIYEKLSLYKPYEFESDTNLTEVKTIVNETHDNLSYMFYGCKKLEQINTTDFDTSNVTTMSNMFNLCITLPELDVSNFVTNKVKNMSKMFADCDSLIELDVSNFNVSNVTNMSEMFGYCNKLELLDLRNWHLSDGTIIGEMFQGCKSLRALRLDNCDYNTIRWLIDCNPNDIVTTYFPTGTIEGVTKTIYCKRAVVGGLHPPTNWVFNYIDVEGIPKYISGEFSGRKTLTSVQIIVNSSHVSLFDMFYDCTALTSVNTEDWDTSKVTNMGRMFCNCSSLASIDVSNWNTTEVINMGVMFNGCTSLTELDLSNFNTSNVTSMQEMFDNCTLLTTLNLSNFDMSKTTYRNNMLRMCTSLHTLRLDNCSYDTINKIITSSNFPTNAIDGVTRTIFCKESEAEGLETPNNWVFSFVPETSSTRPLYKDNEFRGNAEITTVEVMVDTSHNALNNMFNGCTSLVSVNAEGWNTSNVINMMNMFNSCSSLVTLDLSSFNTSNVTNMNWMFINCSKLETLDIRNFDTSKATANMRDMFNGCTSLTTLRLDNCSADTISSIITQSSFPVDNVGVIYCSRAVEGVLTAPGNWNFNYNID